MNRSIALILAGGVGSRMNISTPKQFVVVDGFTVLQHTMMAFQQHQLVNAIYIVTPTQWQDSVLQQAKEAGIGKFAACIPAGESSFLSARNGIRALCEIEKPNTVVLIHDAVRPLVSQDIISRNIAVCLSRGNAITTLPSQESYMVISHKGIDDSYHNDNVKSNSDLNSNDKRLDSRSHSGGGHNDSLIASNCAGIGINSTDREIISTEYIPREKLLRAQTPHTFPLKELQLMMQQADERGITQAQSIFTLANELGHVPLHIAEGEKINFKLTYPSDITIFQAILHEMRA